MVVSSNPNKSPSPISSRTNPNSRIQESRGVRKSFSGDPFSRPSIVPNPRGFNPVTPANSPADFPQRNSSHREGLVSLRIADEQKENEKNLNLKPARVRLPAVSTGTKSFMAPTVSAASKINASPRKKVLTERNEDVRISTSFSVGKSPFTAMNSSDSKFHTEGPQKSDASLIAPAPDVLTSAANPGAFVNKVPTETPDLSLFKPDPRTVESKCKDADLGSKVKPSLSPSPVLAPLDLDPRLPPYDPKTNYLSPRPQFLHYKPNPRIEVYFNKERGFDIGEGKRLEECFSSESSSETENTEESQSPSHQKEYEDDDSSQMISEEDNENNFSEPELNINQGRNVVVPVNQTQKLHLLARSKSISLLLFLVVACLCFPVSDTPIQYSSLFRSQTFSKFDSLERIAEFARIWSVASSGSYLSKLISFPNEVEAIGSLEFLNSTSVEKHLADQYQTVNYGYNDTEKIQDVGTVENVEEEVTDIQANVEFEEQPKLIVQASDLKPENPETEEFLEEGDFDSYNNIEPTNVEVAEKVSNVEVAEKVSNVEVAEKVSNVEVTDIQANVEFEEQPKLIVQASDLKPENPETEESLEEGDFDSYNNIEPTNVEVAEKVSNTELEELSPLLPKIWDVEPDISEADSQGENEPANAEVTAESSSSKYSHGSFDSLEAPESSLEESNYWLREVLGISSVVLTMLIAALLCLKQNKASVPVEQLAMKKLSSCPVLASSHHLNQERTSLRIWPAEVKKVGQSGPSEMSSTSPGSSNRCKKDSDSANEVKSHGRKPSRSAKRESWASSSEFSDGSPSYGSFTTYEKIQSKHKSGDEEMVTPVRRSSRIRNQLTSP